MTLDGVSCDVVVPDSTVGIASLRRENSLRNASAKRWRSSVSEMKLNSPFMRDDDVDMTEELCEILEKDLLETGFSPPFIGECS